MSDATAKTNSSESDAEKLTQELELELIQKRATWKQAGARYQTIRTVAFLFLLVLIISCLLGLLFVFSRVNEQRASQRGTAQTTAAGR